MPKNKISEYDVVASNNTDIAGINIDEGCAPSGINNALRALMSDLKDFQAGTSGDTLPVASGGTGATTTAGARTALGLVIGTDVQAYDVDTLKADVADTLTAPFRGTITTDNDLNFNLSTTNNFKCTPSAGGALTFSNHVAGQSGYVLLINTAGVAITASATTKITADNLTTISTAGTYLVSYFDDGTNAYCTVSASYA